MQRPKLNEDIKPLSEFRANPAALLDRVRSTKRPLVLTRRGHSAAVVVDVSEYERLLDENESLRDIRLAESQIAEGQGIPNSSAKRQVLALLDD